MRHHDVLDRSASPLVISALAGWRFFDNLAQTQIAERVFLTEMYVSCLLTKVLAVMRGSLVGN